MANSTIRALQRSSKTILLLRQQQPIFRPTINNLKHFSSSTKPTLRSPSFKDPPDLRVLNHLRYEIQYEQDTATITQPVPEFNSFSVDEKPNEQWVKLTRKFGENEEIKVEVSMIDVITKNLRIDQDVNRYMSMLVSICKGEGNDVLEFICSVWPGRIKIRDVYTRNEKRAGQQYMGPGFRDLDDKLQESLYEYLGERGVDEKLATFLHKYMQNKEKSEYIRWLERVNSFMEMK